eukprot:g34249.t1
MAFQECRLSISEATPVRIIISAVISRGRKRGFRKVWVGTNVEKVKQVFGWCCLQSSPEQHSESPEHLTRGQWTTANGDRGLEPWARDPGPDSQGLRDLHVGLWRWSGGDWHRTNTTDSVPSSWDWVMICKKVRSHERSDSYLARLQQAKWLRSPVVHVQGKVDSSSNSEPRQRWWRSAKHSAVGGDRRSGEVESISLTADKVQTVTVQDRNIEEHLQASFALPRSAI